MTDHINSDPYKCHVCGTDITEEVRTEVKSIVNVFMFFNQKPIEIIVSCPNKEHSEEFLVSFMLTREQIKTLKEH